MNTHFKKKETRHCIWKSPNGTIKNEIDFVISNNKNLAPGVYKCLRSSRPRKNPRFVPTVIRN